MFVKIWRWVDKYKFWWLLDLVQKNKYDIFLEQHLISNEYQLV